MSSYNKIGRNSISASNPIVAPNNLIILVLIKRQDKYNIQPLADMVTHYIWLQLYCFATEL